MYAVITRGVFEPVDGPTSAQRITFTDAEKAIRYASQSESAWSLNHHAKVERTEVAPTLTTLLRISLKGEQGRFWIEVRSDLPYRPGTADLKP